jgi:hypothetical protein
MTRTVTVGYYNYSAENDDKIDPSMVIPSGNAEPTSRVLGGSTDHGFAEEWAEPATMPNGDRCHRMYLFDLSDITDDEGEPLDAEDYPWDDAHVARIKLVG